MLVIFVFRLGSQLPCLFHFLFYFSWILCLFRFSRTLCHFFFCFACSNPIRWHLKLLARALVSDVCFISIQVMYIDVVPDKVIWTVNWLHYLNYEAITRSSIIRHWFIHGMSSGQTISPYRWCDGIPRVVPVFRSFSERICV